jgi:DNA-binding Xre family transcriptional regulator
MWNYWEQHLHKIKPMTSLSELKKMCAERGVSIGQVFDDIGINRSVLSRWEKREPKSILTYRKIYERIEKIPKRGDN